MKGIKKILFVFRTFGQSPCDLAGGPSARKTHNLRYLLFVQSIIATFSAVLALNGLQYIPGKFYQQSTNLTVAGFLTISLFVTTAIIYFHTWTYHYNLYELWKKFNLLERIFKMKFKRKICFGHFARRYTLKVLVSFAFFFVFTATRFLFPFSQEVVFLQMPLVFLHTTTLIGNYHALFYFELFSHFERYACEIHIGQPQIKPQTSSKTMKPDAVNLRKLNQYLTNTKYVVYELKEISDIINRHFGWSIVSLCVQNFIEAMFSVFWLLIFTHDNGDDFSKGDYKILRKSA